MRSISPELTPDLKKFVGNQTVAKAAALPVSSFRGLVEHVARLSYANKDHLMFFRGQSTDHKNKAGASSFYPSIYRGERLTRSTLEFRFDILSGAGKRLSEAFRRSGIEGAGEVRRRKLVQWSILQHYEVCRTPLLDFTQSVRVACSFALLEAGEHDPFVYAFGLPYLTNRVSVNSEHDLVNLRLLSICPPDALRPYFQEGYVAGTDEVTNDYVSRDELDFNRRLIAKFAISRAISFWSGGFDPIPRKALYPDNDRIKELCDSIREEVRDGTQRIEPGGDIRPSELGEFLQAWSRIESRLLTMARRKRLQVYTVLEAIRVLEQAEMLPVHMSRRLNALRQIQNTAVHRPDGLKPGELQSAIDEIPELLKELKAVAVGSDSG